MKLKDLSAKRLMKWSAALLVWVPVSGISFVYASGGKRSDSWCLHQGAPADWSVADGRLATDFGPPTILRCHWITPTGTKTIEYAWWTNQIFWTLNTLVLTSIPELLLWAVWLAWNKRRPVPTLVTRVFLVVSALWLLVIIRALGYALHYLN